MSNASGRSKPNKKSAEVPMVTIKAPNNVMYSYIGRKIPVPLKVKV